MTGFNFSKAFRQTLLKKQVLHIRVCQVMSLEIYLHDFIAIWQFSWEL